MAWLGKSKRKKRHEIHHYYALFLNSFWWDLNKKWILLAIYLRYCFIPHVIWCLLFPRAQWSSQIWPQCCMRKASGNPLINSILRISLMTRATLWSQRLLCLSQQVCRHPFWHVETAVNDFSQILTDRSSHVSRWRFGSYGTLPHHGDSAEEVQVHLAWGCRRARLHPSLWGHAHSQTLSHEDPTKGDALKQTADRIIKGQ